MSFGLQDCCTPCATPETVNIPGIPGEDGASGADGTNGVSAFTVTLADFTVPPADGTTPVTVEVADTSWMAQDEPLWIPGGGIFVVDAIIDSTHVSVVYPDVEVNVNAGANIVAGTSVVPTGLQPQPPALPTTDPVTKYGSGTAHTITGAAFAAVVFGTSGTQEITLTTAGTWLLQARARVDFVAATFAAVRTVSFKNRRTNNTAGDVANSATAFKTPLSGAALTYTALDVVFPPVTYATANVNDVLQMQVAIDTDPGAGSVQIVEADIVATYLHA